jgi:septal ring factor EnvC (AmiA/AmiB activator)
MALARDALRSSQERSLAFERAFLNQGPKNNHTAVYSPGVGANNPDDAAQGFAAMKGRLPFPLSGRSEVERVRRPGAGGMGLEMSAPRGAPVRAVHPGRVAFADTYADYGQTVIVDHSGGYYTVSAALDQVEVRAGDEVRVGDRLGTVGGDARGGDAPQVGGAAKGGRSYLYFEVRAGADVIDPNVWFGI